jgi:hypothetical protein
LAIGYTRRDPNVFRKAFLAAFGIKDGQAVHDFGPVRWTWRRSVDLVLLSTGMALRRYRLMLPLVPGETAPALEPLQVANLHFGPLLKHSCHPGTS